MCNLGVEHNMGAFSLALLLVPLAFPCTTK